MKCFAPLAALAFAACTGVAPSTSSSSQPIIHGSADDSDPAIVAVFIYVPGRPGAALCTGEVISPHVVLTAAHCVETTSLGFGLKFLVYTGSSLVFDGTVPTTNILATTVSLTDPMWHGTSNGVDPSDLALLILAEPTDIPPLPYNRLTLPDTLKEPPLRIVGYGLTDGKDTTGATAGTKHSAPSTLFQVRSDSIQVWDYEHSACEGDSGGPSLMMLEGKERIVGVTAFGYEGCTIKLPGTATRVDVNTAFIDQWVNQYDPARVPPGGACSADSDCGTLPCLDGVCTPACDPKATADSCPAGLTCTSVDDMPRCAKPQPYHGCAFTPAATEGAPLALPLALLALLALRRRASTLRG